MFDTRRLNDKNKVIVTAALTGAVCTKDDNPNLPTQPEQIAKSAIECYRAGAAVAHIHVRDDDDKSSMDFNKFEQAVNLIRKENCPIILNLTTSGAQNQTYEDRVKPFRELKPEMASFDAGTMNWLNSTVFMNEPKFLEYLGQQMQISSVKPEIEVFDIGMINNAKYYIKKGIITGTPHFQICLGAPGGMEATADSLLYMVNHLPENCTWATFGVGKGAMEIAMTALAIGGNIRVGFEDNVYYQKGELAVSNAQFVERIGRLAKEMGKTLATPDEAREILGLAKM